MSDNNPFTPWMEKFNIHQETVDFFLFAMAQGFKPAHLSSLEESRENIKKLVGPVDFDGTIKTMNIEVPNYPYAPTITIYTPPQAQSTSPVIAYCHGGGFIMNDQTVFDGCMKKLAQSTGAIMVYIEYRLLPCEEDPLAPFNDCHAVIEWLMKNKETVGGSAASKFGIVGDSAGGQTCLSIVQDIREGIDFQVVVYPIVNLTFDAPSTKELSEVPGLNPLQFAFQYKIAGLLTEEMVKNPRVNLELVKDWTSSPPTLVITTALEPLKDFNFELVDKLKAANVQAELVVMEGVPHGFFSRAYFFPTKHAEACQYIADFVKKYI